MKSLAQDGSIKISTKLDDSGLVKGLGKLGSVAKTGMKATVSAIGAVGAALAGAGAAAIKTGSEFEASVAKASTLFGGVKVDAEGLNAKILAVSDSTGVAASQIGESLYNALSAGIPVTEDMGAAMQYMEQSAKLAKAGFTDIDTAVTATAKVLNAYKMDVSETDKVHKILMQTQNKGITTVGELGSVLAQVTPTAAAMNVSFEQVGAALATMTAQGTPTAQATTQLNSLLAELGRKGQQANVNLQAAAAGTKYAGMSFQEMMQAGVPLNEVLGLMDEHAKKSGKSMIDMFGSIEAGKAALAMSGQNTKQYADNLAAMGTEADLVGVAYEKVSNTLANNTQKIGNSLKNIGIAIYNDYQGPLAEVSKTALDMVQQLSSAFSEGGLEGLITSVGDVFAQVVQKAASAAPQLIQTAVQFVQSFLSGLQANLPAITQGAINAVTALIQGASSVWPQVVQLGCDLLIQLTLGIAQSLPTLVPTMVEVVMQMVQCLIDNLPMLIDAALQLILGLAEGLIAAIPVLIEALPAIISSLVEGLLGAVPQIIEAGITLLTALVEALPEIISQIVEVLPEIIDGIINAIVENYPLIMQAGIDLFLSLIKALPEIIVSLTSAMPQIITSIVGALVEGIPQLIEMGVQLFIALIENLPTIIIEICKAAPQIVGGLVQAFAQLTSKLWDIGKNLLTGIWEGISKATAWLWGKIKEWCGNLLDGIKGFFGIHSPSKVMRDEVGKMLMLGLAKGIEQNSEAATKEFQKALEKLDNLRDFDLLSEEEYYTQLTKLRDEYLTAGTKEWYDYTQKIYQYQKQLNDKLKQQIKETYETIAERALSAVEKINDAQRELSDKMKQYGQLYQEKQTIFRGAGEHGEDLEFTDIVLDLSAQRAELEKYAQLLEEVKRKDEIPAEMFALLREMPVDEAVRYADALLSASDADLKRYVEDWQAIQQLSDNTGTGAFEEDLAHTVQEQYKLMADELAAEGKELPEGFFDRGEESAERFGEGFVGQIETIVQTIKTRFETEMQKVMDSITANMQLMAPAAVVTTAAQAGASSTTYQTQYYFASSGETIQQQLQTAQAADDVNRLRGR